MSRNPNLESSQGKIGPVQIDGPEIGQELSYWLSRGLGYAALCGGLIFGLSTIFIF